MSEATLQRKLDRVTAKVKVLEDMIEDKTRELFLANENLSSALDYQRKIYRILPESLLVIGFNGVIKDANESAAKLLGYPKEQLVGTSLAELWDTATQTLTAASEHAVSGEEHAWRANNGIVIPVLVSVSRLTKAGEGETEFVCIATDLRERKRLESETQHAQKLQSVGQLAAGVAHEINTPMQFIGDNIHFLRDSFGSLIELIEVYDQAFEALPEGSLGEPIVEQLDDAQEEADVEYLRERGPRAFERTLGGVTRVSEIVAAMKSFSHPGNDKAPTDLNAAIETTLTVATAEYKYVAEVDIELGELPSVLCHGGDINQVLLNLIVNAAHAIEDQQQDGQKGTIRIRSALEGDSVVISVADSGCGIPEHVRDRIFDPFFTTKEVGRGTGQGLSLARSIVTDKHGGSLSFETEIGAGTTFFIRLPVAPGETDVGSEAAA